MSRPKLSESVQVAVRLPTSLLSLADSLARELSTEAMPVTRSDALRMALRVGLDRITERELAKLGVPVDPLDP